MDTADYAPLAIIPRPVEVIPGSSHFRLDGGTTISTTPEFHTTARYLRQLIHAWTGLSLHVGHKDHSAEESITIDLSSSDGETDLGDEGYLLAAAPNGVTIRAGGPAGAFYAVQTLRQILKLTATGWQIPAVTVWDKPRFKWRGLHLDCARHMFPVDFIKRYIDLMALHKLNAFHWHLTDDQGWRIEIKKYPRLTEVGSRRAATPYPARRDQTDGFPYGSYYTQAQIREVVAYAASRNVTVLPEIEMPGHALAALASFPELGCSGGPYQVATSWGVFEDVFCAGNEAVYSFLEDVLDEVIDLFPGEYVHIGGDECPQVRWEACPKCQKTMKVNGLEDYDKLQSYFTKRVAAYLTGKGRRLVGWDEILEGGLAPDATVMVWRDPVNGIRPAQRGHDVIMCPTAHCYFDYYQSADPESEPPAIGGYLPLEQVYSFEPVPDGLPTEHAVHIIGGQGNVWTEYIQSTAHVEYMAFPRATALAEVLWSPREGKDYQDFIIRLPSFLRRLDYLGVSYWST